MRSRTLPALVALFACFASGQSRAVDGVLEISQTCAVETGCFEDDRAGLPITITGIAGRSYRLTSDLIVPDENTDVVQISGSDVSLDLGGFRIQGPNSCAGTPTTCKLTGSGDGVAVTDVVAVSGVEVVHGSVMGMGRRGVDLGDLAMVRELRSSQNGLDGISVNRSSTVTASVASRNGNSGIVANIDSSLSGCTASSNFSEGIFTLGAAVSGCTASSNGRVGILAIGHSTVIGSVARANGQQGISISSGSTVSTSSASYNAEGIKAEAGTLVIGNSVWNNNVGLRLSDDAAYRENVITSNTASAVLIYTTGVFVNLGDNFCTDDAGAQFACP